jgi:shikimate dehydrogenase
VKLFGIIGYPLSHSFSNKYFTEKFERLGLKDHLHKTFPIDSISKFPGVLKENPALIGLNVTIPYKESVIPFLNELDPIAKEVGAVNTIRATPDSQLPTAKLTGYNTDAFGFRQAIKPFLATQHSRALILGTGGASKAVAYVLKELGIEYNFVTRKKNDPRHFSYSELNPYHIAAHKLIINCTPLGMFPNVNDAPQIPYDSLTSEHFCFDLIYNPAETQFLQKAKAKGALTQNGMTMLIQQAEKAWEIWNS